MSSGDDVSVVEQGEDDEKLGGAFYLRLAGILVVVGILILIGIWIFWRALYAWGFFGAFIALAVIAMLFGWIYDRRNKRP
jgi:hypothetical protein